MSYELTISKGYRYAEDGWFSEIAKSEWDVVIEANDELTAIEKVTAQNPVTGEVISINTPDSAQISEGPVLSWKCGAISVPHSDEFMLFYKDIATALNAQIYGEEGETY